MLDFDSMFLYIIGTFLAIVWILFQDWFWTAADWFVTGVQWLLGLLFLLCGIASFMAVLINMIYLQILAAIGFFFLALVLAACGVSIMESS